MGKKQKEGEKLGRSLMKDKSGKKNKSKMSLRHTSELQDGQDFNRINFKSITEQTDVDNFLSTAELAGTDFTAEKLNIKFVRPSSMIGVLTKEERNKIKLIQEDNEALLRIPRRPPWDRSTSAEELAEAERETFLEWRRTLVQLQEKEGIVMTPYEKNIEFWRQLWRVIERSDVVVQIVDARNPFLFYCQDLSRYVREIDWHKENLLLVNKADFLIEEQRARWADYFEKTNIKAVFFSATLESSLQNTEEGSCSSTQSPIDEGEMEDNLLCLNISDGDETDSHNFESSLQECKNDLEHLSKSQGRSESLPLEEISCSNQGDIIHLDYINSSKLLNRKELIELFKNLYSGPKLHSSHVTIGLVGYPNVGKSSTINSLLQEKKVSVSATPGKTKHFQTLFLSDDILLCDCPGLVFPAFVTTKEEMIISGILPIDQMRDHVPPMNLLLSLIPRHVLESKYGVRIPLPSEGEDPNRSPISEEFLSVYGYMRGFMTQRGIPDHPRSARYILKDYINGKLLYCHSPPGESQDYHKFIVEKVRKTERQSTPQQLSALPRKQQSAAIDTAFFSQNASGVHYKGQASMKPRTVATSSGTSEEGSVHKPWRAISKRNTRQKARIKYAHLDF